MSRAALAALVVLGLGCQSPRVPTGGNAQLRPPPPELYNQAATGPAPVASAFIYLPGAASARQVRYQVHGGMAVYQGDIMLGQAQLVPIVYARPRAGGDGRMYAAASSKAHRWPGGVMPFEIDASVSPDKRAMIDWAVAHVSAATVLKPRPRAAGDADYLQFTEASGEHGCSSYVGRIGGAQLVRVSGCGVRGSVVHEMLHAAGLYHEQSRTDRDGYVTIQWSEISPGEEPAFTTDVDTMDIGPYDYGSIMHYSRAAFSRSGNDTIIPKDPRVTIGQREGVSPGDQAAIAQLYAGSGPAPGALPGAQPGVVVIPGMPPIPLPPGTPPIQGWPAGLPALPGWPTGAPQAPPGTSAFPQIPPLPSGLPSSIPLPQLQ